MLEGDLDGAELLLVGLDQEQGSMHEEVVYHRAQIDRLRGNTDEARRSLTSLATGDGHRAADSCFLLADLEATAKRPAEALAWLRKAAKVAPVRGPDKSRWTLSFASFSADLLTPGRAERSLVRVLKRAPYPGLSWYEARAWSRLARVRVDAADAVAISGGERRLRANLLKRQGLILEAEQAVNQTIALEEPEWVLDGILALADGYEAYGDSLRESAFPTYLLPEQQVRYADGIAEQVEKAWLRALTYLDRAEDMAARLRWDTARATAVKARATDLQHRLERGEARPTPPGPDRSLPTSGE
jgi:tetratricopeptide (TPR) repeat protein